jgi:hypothetical protein
MISRARFSRYQTPLNLRQAIPPEVLNAIK